MNYDLYTSQNLMDAFEQTQPVRRFLLDTFFPERNTKYFDTKNVLMDVKKGVRQLAPFCTPQGEGVSIDGVGYDTYSTRPAYINVKRTVTAQDVQGRDPGENPFAPKSVEEKFNAAVGRAMSELDETVARREEHMAAQALFTGKLRVRGPGVDFVVDMGYRPGEHIVTMAGGERWDNGANAVNQIRRLRRRTAARGGLSPNIVIVGEAAAEALLENERVQRLLDLKNYDAGVLSVQYGANNGITYLGKLAGMDLYEYDELFTDPDTGATESLVPPECILVGSSEALCRRAYGLIEHLDCLKAVSRFHSSKPDANDRGLVIRTECAPMLNMVQADAFTIARVV